MASEINLSASYKKQDGTLVVTADRKAVKWTGSNSSASLLVSEVINLGKSPDTSAKASVKLTVQRPGMAAPESYVFVFTSPTAARAEQTTFVDALRLVIAANKEKAEGKAEPRPEPKADRPDCEVDSDEQLMSDIVLQKSLLSIDPQLRQRFDEALKGKPDTITISQFSAHFWSTRIHLLRAHAIEKKQMQGPYNVLSVVKLDNVETVEGDGVGEGKLRMTLSKEQIQDVFSQHPIVRRIYNDLVPRVFAEMDFWAKFFVSRLCKKLKGERITDMDPAIGAFDKYLNFDEKDDRTKQFTATYIPRFLDLDGNEQNNSQRRGNAPDIMMRPNPHDKVPILRVLNMTSEKLMANAPPSDGPAHNPVGMDEETYREVRLRDLQLNSQDNQIRLIRRQPKPAAPKSDGKGIDAKDAIAAVCAEVSRQRDLPAELGEDGDREATSATNNLIGRIKRTIARQASSGDVGLSSDQLASTTMTHNTTIEFLHYFWDVYYSGDESRADELSKLAETLLKSLERAAAVAEVAETERMELLRLQKAQADQYLAKTGKRLRVDPVSGGREAVKALLRDTARAVRRADVEYKQTFAEQMAAQAQGAIPAHSQA
ncbi:hypothetical protein EJ06DRAFT_476616 [Trichodelitschia bisporula]|uniref:BSD domain-containing protein n=1 Tax=Trichodelitschia bisporula TaxID=703511 RepID=A0A6G1HXJ7_9PEZI|nr:hypothetical protein EJ06DRAFT_476616 [Trichodelitschia bisporula]